jgi:hypothetical protein
MVRGLQVLSSLILILLAQLGESEVSFAQNRSRYNACAGVLLGVPEEPGKVLASLSLRDELLNDYTQRGPDFVKQMDFAALVEDLFILAEGWRYGSIVTLSLADAQVVTRYLGLHLPDTTEIKLNIRSARADWMKRNVFFRTVNVLELLYNEVLHRSVSWEVRAALFRHYLSDPETIKNTYISAYALDPLLGLDTLGNSRFERTRFGVVRFDDSSQQRTSLGFRPVQVWSSYGWIHALFEKSEIHSGDTVVDIGSGLGRVGLYVAAMYPDVKVVGIELVDRRIQTAQSVVKRFNLEGRIQYLHRDLQVDGLPDANIYFYFNSLSEPVYNRMLNLLRHKAAESHYQLLSVYDEFGQLSRQNFLHAKASIEVPFREVDEDPQTGELKVRFAPMQSQVFVAMPSH